MAEYDNLLLRNVERLLEIWLFAFMVPGETFFGEAAKSSKTPSQIDIFLSLAVALHVAKQNKSYINNQI